MKKLLFILAAILLVACDENSPTRLRVDYVRGAEQTLIHSTTPVFGWQVSNPQSAYQIIVSSSKACKVGDTWDSDKVESTNSHAVEYSGAPLEYGATYYWRVCYWDSEGVQSDFSQVEQFTLATQEDMASSIVTSNHILSREDSAISTKEVAKGEYLFDFGRAAFGTLRLDMKVSEDTKIIVRAGEQLSDKGRIVRKPKGTIRYCEVEVELKKGESAYDVIFPKNKRNTAAMAIPIPKDWGVIMPFRYVEIANIGANDIGKLKPSRKVWYGHREPLGGFESSNSTLDSIWEICRYTIEATDFLGYYIDGDRERIPYEADAYINQLCHYAVDAEYAIGKKSLEYFISHATWPTEWFLHTIMIAYQDYMHTGDTRIIAKYYDTLKDKTLHELSREDGLISTKSEKMTKEFMQKVGYKQFSRGISDIVDWPPASFTKDKNSAGERDGHEMMPINTVVNSFYYLTLTQMSEMANVIGKESDSKEFAHMAREVKESINTKLFDSTKGIYVDGEGSAHSSLHSNMLPVACGVIEPENMASVAEFIKSRGMACSVYGAQYLFEALYAAGESQYALELMTNKSDRGWYNMIKVGSTMTLEAWDIKYKNNLDWNHAWGAAPANLIPRQMWGIQPTQPGYKHAHIKPQLANLTHSQIAVPTLQGEILASYSNEGGVKLYELYIPANMSATFESVEGAITLNGTKISGKVSELLIGKNTIKIE
ncbi:MAG: family 78 glycoside hydrolase catalytic domain [Rikenellaceae bacterium]